MAAGERGQTARMDGATQSLRQALLQAEDDAQRVRVLETIAQRAVFAPTWPNSPDALRTLTNSDGEHAMPLFSAIDTLQAAARRFGWAQPDGGLGYRELPAGEALRSALEQGVHYVVLDIFAEHATEFSRDEVAHVLQRMPAAVPRAKEPAAAAAPAAARAPAVAPRAPAAAPRAQPEPKPAPGPAPAPAAAAGPKPAAKNKPGAAILGEIDMPFASRRNSAPKPAVRAVVEEMPAAPRREGAPRVDPRAEPDAQPVRRPVARIESGPRAEPLPAAKPPQPQRAPSTLKEQPAPRAERAAIPTPGAFAAPRAERAPNPTPAAFAAPRAERAANPTPGAFAAPPAIEPLPAAPQPPRVAPPPAQPTVAIAAPAPPLPGLPSFDAPSALPLAGAGADAAPAVGFGFDAEPEPEANPAALQAAAMVAQVAKLAGDADTQKAAAEVAAMLQDMARKGVVEEAKPNAAQSAAKLLAGMLSADAAATEAKRNKRPESKQAIAAVEPSEPSTAENAGLRPLDPPLPDALLDLISDALRKYPEVEWACELADGSAVPVVGVRIDPSFQTRAAEVRAAVLAIASKRKTELSVLLLSDAQLTKEARANGSAFFPWRKRAPKR